jgi:hypothetical protein
MMRAIFSNSSEVLIWLGPNLPGDHIGQDHVVQSYQIESEGYKCSWYNDCRDDDMVKKYFTGFLRYDAETIEREGSVQQRRRLSWSRDIFGAFFVLNRLSHGIHSKDLRMIRTSMTSAGQLRWSSRLRKGLWAMAESSWVSYDASTQSCSSNPLPLILAHM